MSFMMEEKKLECPFCNKISINSIYYPPVTQVHSSRAAGRTAKTVYTTRGRYEITSGCSECGKSKKEIEKAMKEGTPEQKTRKKKRLKELLKLREEMRKEHGKH